MGYFRQGVISLLSSVIWTDILNYVYFIFFLAIWVIEKICNVVMRIIGLLISWLTARRDWAAFQGEMASSGSLGGILWLMMTMMMAGKEALKLMTRPDGEAVCATDPPTAYAALSPRMPGAPAQVRCGMACAGRAGCKHFNYVSKPTNDVASTGASSPCQLYDYRPTTFDVVSDCQHYYEPGRPGTSAGFWLWGSMPPCRLRRRKFWKFDYEMVHSEVYLTKYVVSIAPFSTSACPDCSENIT